MSYTDPNICVLIPAYNEELVITGTIEALLSADCDRRDIYVVDDRSTDHTAQLASKLGVHVYTVPTNGGKAKAQVAAIEHFNLLSRYEWIVFLDGDSKVDISFMTAMYTAAKTDPTVGLYVGQVKSVNNKHIFSAARAYDYAYGQDVAKHGQSNFNVVYVSPGCSSMYRCDLLEKLTIDHSTLAEDMDLTLQVHRVNEKVVYLPSAIVNTQDPSTLHDYNKQVSRWYRGFWQVVIKHGILRWGNKQRVDWYMLFLIVDSILFNRIFWLIGLLVVQSSAVPYVVIGDIIICGIIAAYAAHKNKRWDVLYKLPIYHWLGYVNYYNFIKGFVEVVILRRTLLDWNKVKRYDFNATIT